MTAPRLSRSRAHARARISTVSSRRPSSSRSTSTSAAARRAAKRLQLLRAMRGSLKRVVRIRGARGSARPHRHRDGGRAGREDARPTPTADAMAAERAARSASPRGGRWCRSPPRRRWRSCGAPRRAERRRRRRRRAPASETTCWPSSWPSTRSRCRSRRKDADAVRGLERYVGVPVSPVELRARRAERAPRRARASCRCTRSGRRCSSTWCGSGTDDAARERPRVRRAEDPDRHGQPRAARDRHRRGARRAREGLLGRGHAERRRRLPRR